MKKIMIMAFVALMATSAVAQNPEALKQIKKAKSADEAKALIQQNESSMSASENAQAYNKLVDICVKSVNDDQQLIQAIDLQKQMGQEPKQEVDMPAFYGNLEEAYEAALTCDKYDMQPNEKDKIAPKFRKSNGERLYSLRPFLINAAQDAQSEGKEKEATKLFALYVVTAKADLFKEEAAAATKAAPDGVGDPYLSEVARVASLTAFQEGNVEDAMKFADIVMEDPNPEKMQEGLSLKMYYTERGLETREDSLKCLETYKELYEKYPNNQDVFSRLASMYGNLGDTDKQNQLVASFLAANPGSFTAWAMKGQIEMNDQKYDEALADYEKALSCEGADDGQKALVNTFVGFCYSQKAAQLEIYEQQIDELKKAIPYLEKARELDPTRERCNWAYPLYNCYYHTKGENDPATEELKNMLGL